MTPPAAAAAVAAVAAAEGPSVPFGAAGDPSGLLAALDAARKLGVAEAAREALPPAADPVVLAVTRLGDTWLLLVALSLFVWFGPDSRGDRRRGALAVALALGALGLATGLKASFGLARPPETLHASPVDGLGFPSGHALGATVVWGSVAVLADRWTRRRRLAAAAVVVAAVALSRVLLGVHYLGDVVAGVAVGAAFLWGGLRLADGDPARAFALSGAVAVGTIAAGDLGAGAAVLGAVLGGGLVWGGLDLEGPVGPAAALAGLVVFGGIFLAVEVVEPALPVVVAADAVVVGGVLAVPAMQRRTGARGAPARR